MDQHINAPIKLFLMVLACVLLFLAAGAWQVAVDPYRPRLGWAGMFCWCLAQFF
jgi:hypothetical protein